MSSGFSKSASGARERVKSSGPYKVMLVDDSAVVRGLFARTMNDDSEVEVAASVGDGQRAIDALQRDPSIEVIVLDIEMPRLDGISALPRLLEIDPDVAIIMASTLTARNADISLKALALGAKDYLTKPTSARELTGTADFKTALLERVKAFGAQRRRKLGDQPVQAGAGAGAPARQFSAARPAPTRTPFARGGTSPAAPARPTSAPAANTSVARPRAAQAPSLIPGSGKPVKLAQEQRFQPAVLAIGSSTGGPQALFKVLGDIKQDIRQPILITQHMPATFTQILAEHISRSTGWTCAEAKDGEEVVGGRVYLAPGNFHMLVRKSGMKNVIQLNDGPPENFCRPAVDPMLRSLAEVYNGRVFVTILTGMGSDGCKGAEAIRAAGGDVIAQDEATSVVWGMPGAVTDAGLCSAVLPLDQIGAHIHRRATGRG